MAAGAWVIYSLRDPSTKEIRYVGKSRDLPARIRAHRWEATSSTLHTYKVNWLRTLTSEPIVEVLETVTETNWAERERNWIKRFRDGGLNLTNFADGGETSPVEGKGHTAETKAKLRALALARGCKPPSRKGMPSWCAGTKGLVKSNSGSFKKGQVPWNKKVTL